MALRTALAAAAAAFALFGATEVHADAAGPATPVATADALVNAVNTGVEHILLTDHIDISDRPPVDGRLNPQVWEFASSLRSMRVRCLGSDC